MSENQPLQDPTNRVVAVFDEKQQAAAARQELIDGGIDGERIRVLHGADRAADVDTSPKWFADTNDEIRRYAHELKAGAAVISAPVDDRELREQVHEILKRHDARMVTHFGEWITEMMQ